MGDLVVVTLFKKSLQREDSGCQRLGDGRAKSVREPLFQRCKEEALTLQPGDKQCM